MTEERMPDEALRQYVIARSVNAGVFAGWINGQLGDGKRRQQVTLTGARRLWYWAGAASLSQLAVTGTSQPGECKFPVEVPVVELPEVCELLGVTEEARASIAAVPVWSA